MGGSIRRSVLIVAVNAFAAIACTTFTSDSEPQLTQEGGPPADAALSDRPSPPLDAAADVVTDFGCAAPPITAALDAPQGGPFTHGVDPFVVVRLADGAGPFVRFSLAIDGPDGAAFVDHRYFLPIAATATHVCTSARIRVQDAPPGSTAVVLLSNALHRDEDMITGFAGVEVAGGGLKVFAGFSGGPAGGTPVTQSVPGSASSWHVARIELDRAGDGAWTAAFVVDGATLLQNVVAFPRAFGSIGSGETGFGPVLVPPAPQLASPAVVVDYADLRNVQR